MEEEGNRGPYPPLFNSDVTTTIFLKIGRTSLVTHEHKLQLNERKVSKILVSCEDLPNLGSFPSPRVPVTDLVSSSLGSMSLVEMNPGLLRHELGFSCEKLGL